MWSGRIRPSKGASCWSLLLFHTCNTPARVMVLGILVHPHNALVWLSAAGKILPPWPRLVASKLSSSCLWNCGSRIDLPFGGPRGRFSLLAPPSISVYWSRLISSDRVSTCSGWFCASSHGSLSGEFPSLGALALRGWWLSPRVVVLCETPCVGNVNNLYPFIDNASFW